MKPFFANIRPVARKPPFVAMDIPKALVSFAIVASLSAASTAAQDVEPTPAKALRMLVDKVASELPWRAPEAKSIAVVAADRDSRATAIDAARALADRGFVIVAEDAEADIATTWRIERASDGGAIVAMTGSSPAAIFRCAFGDAAWIEDPASRDRVLRGRERSTREAAIASARAEAVEALSRRFPLVAKKNSHRIRAAADKAKIFVAERADGDECTFTASILPSDGAERILEVAERGFERRSRTAKGLRLAGAIFAAAACYASFRLFDWRTRGWRTRRLRALFATLFAAAVFGLWRIPL